MKEKSLLLAMQQYEINHGFFAEKVIFSICARKALFY